MPGYQRFVAYVYEYCKGLKEENRGYIRVEARGEVCRIDINIKCPGLPPNENCEVKGILRTTNGEKGVKIGGCKTYQDTIQTVLTCATDNLDGEGTGLANIGGVILKTEGGAFFGTEWDDIPIKPESFTENRKEKAVQKEEAQKEEAQKEEVQKEEVQKEEIQNEKTQKEKIQKAPDQKRGFVETEIADQDDSLENLTDTVNVKEDDESHTEDHKMKTQEMDIPIQIMEKYKPEIEKKSVTEKATVLPGEPFQPFSDGEISECRKIQPRDLQYLRPCDRILRKNHFLAHGYYIFGHLLLGKTLSGQYILGVPGGYDQQERFMANMHGFSYFKESNEIRIHHGRGGYWYRLINTPNFHQRNGFQ